ncbi:MAG: FAD-binding protein, partial [Proteobacteria bacterium]|nr:FAD-binding protein [Pseudomonadota bacterium]
MSVRVTDSLIIGGGISGLLTALKLCRYHQVALVMKSTFEESNSYQAQGGIATVISEQDSREKHKQDTINAGDGLCHHEVVSFVVDSGPKALVELTQFGVPFSKTKSGEYHLTQEGGHSQRRVLHVSDQTGAATIQVLYEAVLQEPRIQVLANMVAIDLITTDMVAPSFFGNRCLGTYVLDRETNKISIIKAARTILCTGGHGRIYQYSSNPPSATGDGVAMASRAGARIANLEFIQFHPTCLYHPLKKDFLISEALRGEGAKIVNQKGQEFISQSEPRGSMGLRHVLARLIDQELKNSGDSFVYLDVSDIHESKWQSHFVKIADVLLELGIDPRAGDPIPVVPCAHYSCGGVVVDHHGCSSITGLYAVGEVSCTG